MGKKYSVRKQTRKSKSTKSKIHKLNNQVDLNEITLLLGENRSEKKVNALQSNELKEGLKKDAETTHKRNEVEKDLTKQVELMTGMNL